MIEAVHRSEKNIPAPRKPEVVSLLQKGYTGNVLDYPPVNNAHAFGVELFWTEQFTMVVEWVDGKLRVELDFGAKPAVEIENLIQPAGDYHYMVNAHPQIVLPRGVVGLILPHPKYFDPVPHGGYNDAPAIQPAILPLDRLRGTIRVICGLPKPGAEQIFYAGQPFAQLIAVPRGDIAMRPMTTEEEIRFGENIAGSAEPVPEGEVPATGEL